MTYRFQHQRHLLPLRAPLRTAHGAWAGREGLLVRIEDRDGRIGFGEVAPIPWFGTETLAEAETVCAGLRGRVGPDILAAIPERYGCVRFAVACALAEVERAVPPRPDEEARGEAAAPPTRLPVVALLPAGKPALDDLRARLEAGFLSFKWKVAVGRPEDELALLDDLLAALPPYARLRLDANGGWDRRQARRWLERCAERPVEFVEQPVAASDEDALRGLAEDFPVTLALDESVVRLADARRWHAAGWRGVFVIKPAICGPLGEIEAWARESRADLVLSSAIETAVARAAILRWALARGITKRALGFGTGELFESRAANGPILGALADAGWAGSFDPRLLWDEIAAEKSHGPAGESRA
ncbi:MAG TPA: o-succinylbenzoate synthase [Opitutaceae bacterium]|nr:o-succinylbenzoate synthase [Opitutaceae bacterium]